MSPNNRTVSHLEALSLIRSWYLTEFLPDCSRVECLGMAADNFFSVRNGGESFSLEIGELTYKPGVGFILSPYDLTGYLGYCDAFIARVKTQVSSCVNP